MLLTSEQRCACQEMQSCRVHVTSFDRWRDAGSRVTERVRPSRNDERFQSSHALADGPHVKHLFQHTAPTMLVSLVTLTAHVCRYLSPNFITLAAGAGAFFLTIERGLLRVRVAVSRNVERLVLLHSAYDAMMSKPSSQELCITTWCNSESFYGPPLA